MKHWTPRIADAAEAALAGGADDDRRARARAALLAALDRRATARSSRRRSTAAPSCVFVEQLARRARRSSSCSPERVRGTEAHVVFTAHSLPARILDEGDPYQDQLLETSRLVAEAAGLSDWSFSLPVRVADRRALARARHPRPPRRRSTRRARPHVLVCPIGFVADHLEIRWDLDTEARREGRRARPRGSSADRDAERRSGLRRRPCARSSGGRSRYPRPV